MYECQNKAEKTKTAIMNLDHKPSESDIIAFKDQLLQSQKLDQWRNICFIDAYVHKATYFVIMEIAA